jgi:hypothetical protein
MAFITDTEVSKATGLVAHMQKLVNENSGLKAFVVVVGGPETKAALENLAAKNKISIPLTFLPRGKEDPALGRYKINPEAKTTVTVSRQNRVLANFVNVGPEQLPQITEATKKMLAEG